MDRKSMCDRMGRDECTYSFIAPAFALSRPRSTNNVGQKNNQATPDAGGGPQFEAGAPTKQQKKTELPGTAFEAKALHPAKLSNWTVEHVLAWLSSTPLPRDVIQVFEDNAINGPVFESLTEQDLLDMGITKFGWRRQLFLSRQELLRRCRESQRGVEGAEWIEIHSARSSPTASPRSRNGAGSLPPAGIGGTSPASLSTAAKAVIPPRNEGTKPTKNTFNLRSSTPTRASQADASSPSHVHSCVTRALPADANSPSQVHPCVARASQADASSPSQVHPCVARASQADASSPSQLHPVVASVVPAPFAANNHSRSTISVCSPAMQRAACHRAATPARSLSPPVCSRSAGACTPGAGGAVHHRKLRGGSIVVPTGGFPCGSGVMTPARSLSPAPPSRHAGASTPVSGGTMSRKASCGSIALPTGTLPVRGPSPGSPSVGSHLTQVHSLGCNGPATPVVMNRCENSIAKPIRAGQFGVAVQYQTVIGAACKCAG